MAATDTRPVGKKADEAPIWSTAFDETDRYGEPTGARVVECRECGVEVLVRDRDTATHRPTCSTWGDA